jgi:isoquinoline 1-oxidoreductase beta subunit
MSSQIKFGEPQPIDNMTTSRRDLVLSIAAGAGALIIGTHIGPGGMRRASAQAPRSWPLNAFVKIAQDNTVTVTIKHLDKGQGVTTGLTTIVADELDARWSQMRTEFAPANDSEYWNKAFPFPIQATGSSTSVSNSWDQLRTMGATARALLIEAAARRWQVPQSAITIRNGVVTHMNGAERAEFGELVELATTLPMPSSVTKKRREDWIFIGKSFPRIDSVAKTTGATAYAMDIRRDGMLTAMVARPPNFGSALKSFNAAAAMAVDGVVEVVAIPQRGPNPQRGLLLDFLGELAASVQDTWSAIAPGVAVIAKDTWSAIRGREALDAQWDTSAAEKRSTAAIFDSYRARVDGPGGNRMISRGNANTALSRTKVIEAEFTFPYLAHAPMEPLNAVLERKPDGRVEAWAGSQFQTFDTLMIAQAFGVLPSQVTVNTVWAGGSFGRRATPNSDYLNELAHIVRAARVTAPIHLVWTREDDIRGGRYRPMVLHHVRAGLADDGTPVAWQHQIVSEPVLAGTMLESVVARFGFGLNATAVEGASDMPYAFANLEVDWHRVSSPVPTLWWRSVSHTHTAHTVEVMIDALAHAAGTNPVAFRRRLLTHHPRSSRYLEVLNLAADKGNIDAILPPGRGRGIALHESFDTIVAMVAEVTVDRGRIKVERIVAAVDCGIAVNPDVIRAQIEGGIGFALGAVLRNKITLLNGVVEQSNFHDYEPLRMSEMPQVEVHIVESDVEPTGIGEPGVPPVAPAVANAVFAATGKRLYSLPLDAAALRGG